jgi:hypothetical protein
MNDWMIYLVLAVLCTGGYWLVGYISRKTYNHVSEGRNR